jgi:hypothetical protein
MANKAHGVGQRVHPAVGSRGTASGWIKGCEQCIVDENTGPSEPVEEAGLAGVGVSDNCDRRDFMAPALRALRFPGDIHFTQRRAQPGNAAIYAPPVGLQLRLAGTAASYADTAAGTTADLPREIAAPAA